MITAARPTQSKDAHWYSTDGHPQHVMEKKDGSGFRPTTIADARKHGWLPSVTTILKALAKPALTNWLIEQAVLAAMTTPRKPNETDDEFIYRVLHVERVQDEEGKAARDIGTEIHAAIEQALNGKPISDEMKVYAGPVLEQCRKFGDVLSTEKTVIGKGYAGKLDVSFLSEVMTICDFKTTKNLPKKESWTEHRLQTSAYSAAVFDNTKEIITANIYISTVEPGKFACFTQCDWEDTYEKGFAPLVKVWQWLNSFYL